jgi:hypothetical protein
MGGIIISFQFNEAISLRSHEVTPNRLTIYNNTPTVLIL